jgi:signal peptidase I
MVAARVATVPRSTRFRYAVGWHVTRGLRLAIAGALVLAAAVAVAPVMLVATGHRPTLVDTDSMEPTMAEGDIILNEDVPVTEVQVGDVLTFADATRAGAVFTERVVDVRQDDHAVDLSTKGDAKAMAHAWSLPEGAKVTRVAYMVPALANPMRVASALDSRLTLVAGAAVVLLIVRRRSRA